MRNRIFFFIISAILLCSCATKKNVTEIKEVVKLDSIYIVKDRFITKQVNDTITVEKPCDSLGQLKDFSRVIVSDKVKVSLKSVKGSIQATVNIDSIVNSKIYEFKKNYKAEKEIVIKETVKYKVSIIHWLVHIVCGLIIYLLIKLP
jgi:hypothetical protein